MASFPRLKQPDGSNMCGAYSLVAALDYLGCFEDLDAIELRKLDVARCLFEGDSIVLSKNQELDEVAKSIYDVTGIIPENNQSIFEYSVGGLNSIAAMAYVASRFDVTPTVLLKDQDTLNSLSALYPQEKEAARRNNINIEVGLATFDTNDRTVLIPTVVNPDSSKHCLALSSRAELFDPATGVICKARSIVAWRNWLGVALKLEKSKPMGAEVANFS